MTNERSTSTLVTSRIGLNIVAKPKYFHNGILVIKCMATLTLVYEYETIEHIVTGSSKNKYKKDWSLLPNLRQPIITGMKKNFRLDEILNLNCTTTMKNAQLKWFINQIPANENDLIHYDNHNNHNHYYDSLKILGLWLRMDKHHLQMPELQLRCVSYFYKQISQSNSTLKIRTFNHNYKGGDDFWDSSSSSSDRCCLLLSSLLLSICILVAAVACHVHCL
ncbi:chromatin assembly factor I P60 subunit-like protein [Euroglyphus maynei]|uniref:Chromatin assembly factor I P60 subunit-like protein n=1 Tax=Euroglyphus maynei TaxID=6958 RepID=A0A1Y3BDY2_EURMA|nr:chromatin assembly factor I P60 subunit-like protein [Euroglyphus maynei]